jgi:hypothetical protein
MMISLVGPLDFFFEQYYEEVFFGSVLFPLINVAVKNGLQTFNIIFYCPKNTCKRAGHLCLSQEINDIKTIFYVTNTFLWKYGCKYDAKVIIYHFQRACSIIWRFVAAKVDGCES